MPLLFKVSLLINLILGFFLFKHYRQPSDRTFIYFHSVSAIEARDTVMLGDSLTAWVDWKEFFPKQSIRNRGVGGEWIHSVMKRIDPILKNRPSRIFIMLGINNLMGGGSLSRAIGDYERLLRKIKLSSPQTQLYVQSLLPLNHKLYGGKAQNQMILDLNSKIKDLCSKMGIEYLDIYSSMAGADGELKQEYTYDGIHLTEKGYSAWIKALGPFMEQEKK